MTTWIEGENGNRASVERWGSEEKARESLKNLPDCSDCSDCSDCFYCSGCSCCSSCSDCFRCSGCFCCSSCSGRKSVGEMPEIPVIADIHKAVYAAASRPGALDMGRFHACETTHCRAGWAVHLAGDAGYALERATSPVFAAMQIYAASGYAISPVRFFDTDEKAMADMKRLAESK